MRVKSKTKKIILSLLLVLIPAITGITIGAIALTKSSKKEERVEQKVQTIKIVSDIPPIVTKKNQAITTDPIQVKCYNQNQRVMDCINKLLIFGTDYKPVGYSWIKINSDNQIIISPQAEVGSYNFLIQATTADGLYKSEYKSFNLTIEDVVESEIPDNISFSNLNDMSIFSIYTKNINLKCKAFKSGKEITNFGDINWSFTIKDSTSFQQTPPLIESITENHTVDLKIITNKVHGLVGSYTLEVKVSLVSNPSISYSQTCEIKVVDEMTYTDTNGYVYHKAHLSEYWTLIKVPSETKIIEHVKQEIDGCSVSCIGANLASNSGIQDAIVKVVLPDSIKTIENEAFYECSYLKLIEMPAVETVKDNAFNYCDLMCLSDPYPKLNYVGNSAFYYCNCLPANLDISYLTNIGQYAFYHCPLTSIELSKDLKLIQTSAFSNMPSLKTVKINASNPPISESNLFSGCSILDTIYVPSNSLEVYKVADKWKELAEKINSF